MVCAFAFAQHFTEFNFLEVHGQQALAFTAKVDRRASVSIDHAALITPATCDLVGVPPEVPELGTIPTNNEQ